MMKTIDIGRLDTAARKEVLEEVNVLASLHHPHLTAVHECFIEGGYLCLVLQYAEGGHAAGQIEKARRCSSELSESQVLRWFTQATLGLKHMHDRSVLHRDLRTRRLLLTSEGHVVISCAAITALLKPTLSPERPDLEAMRYLSPELVDGKEHTAASDMWALGAILYELAAMSPPFDHPHPRGLAERILSGPARPLPRRCSREVQSLCSSLMQRQAQDRLTSTDTLRQPIIQDRLCKLFDEEPAFVPGSGAASARTDVTKATPRRGGFGALLPQSPAAAPRGLRHVGETVTGIKCGSLGVTGTTALRGPSRASSESWGGASLSDSREFSLNPEMLTRGAMSRQQSTESSAAYDSSPRRFSTRRGSARRMSKERRASGLSPEEVEKQLEKLKTQVATEHAQVYAGIMVETALEELNFTSSRLLEEDVPLGRFSLPTSVDTTSGATWQIDKEVMKTDTTAQSPRLCDIAPPAHDREFPRFT